MMLDPGGRYLVIAGKTYAKVLNYLRRSCPWMTGDQCDEISEYLRKGAHDRLVRQTVSRVCGEQGPDVRKKTGIAQ